MKIQLLGFEGCPNVDSARAALKEALREAATDTQIEEIEIGRDDAPAWARGWGSPTILIDGTDVAGGEPSGSDLGCRLYAGGAPLTVIEAALTGESVPVEKDPNPVDREVPLAERHDHVFTGTSIATGTAVAEVVATGMQSELGKIAHLLTTAQESTTPLQARLARVSKILMIACLGVVAVVSVAGMVRGLGVFDVLLAAVSLAVAAVPEGLPAILHMGSSLSHRCSSNDRAGELGPIAQRMRADRAAAQISSIRQTGDEVPSAARSASRSASRPSQT